MGADLSLKLKSIFLGVLWVFIVHTASAGRLTEPMDQKSIAKRIEPVGVVNVVDSSGQAVAAKADEPVALGPNAAAKRYKTSCALCHDQGVAGAPKFKNKADWSSRGNIEVLLASAIKGKGAMPPKGTCMQCSDEELKITIEYMLP
jgi:cytochrome c5